MAPDSAAPVVLAAAAHPDDIEFMMSGTLVLLGQAGCSLHYLNIANGSCGSWIKTREQIISIRTDEAREAARSIGAVFHEPLVDDIMIYYEDALVRRLCAIVRDVKPQIVLLQSPQDYMEDHMISSRLMVTAAFCRNMPNYVTEPEVPAADTDIAVYHALPYGLHDQLCQPVKPHFTVDVSGCAEQMRAMLACHRSQKEWLDLTQGFDNYLNTQTRQCAEVGRRWGGCEMAEGWRRHLHLGFGPENYDPLCQTLAARIRQRDCTHTANEEIDQCDH